MFDELNLVPSLQGEGKGKGAEYSYPYPYPCLDSRKGGKRNSPDVDRDQKVLLQ